MVLCYGSPGKLILIPWIGHKPKCSTLLLPELLMIPFTAQDPQINIYQAEPSHHNRPFLFPLMCFLQIQVQVQVLFCLYLSSHYLYTSRIHGSLRDLVLDDNAYPPPPSFQKPIFILTWFGESYLRCPGLGAMYPSHPGTLNLWHHVSSSLQDFIPREPSFYIWDVS